MALQKRMARGKGRRRPRKETITASQPTAIGVGCQTNTIAHCIGSQPINVATIVGSQTNGKVDQV